LSPLTAVSSGSRSAKAAQHAFGLPYGFVPGHQWGIERSMRQQTSATPTPISQKTYAKPSLTTAQADHALKQQNQMQHAQAQQVRHTILNPTPAQQQAVAQLVVQQNPSYVNKAVDIPPEVKQGQQLAQQAEHYNRALKQSQQSPKQPLVFSALSKMAQQMQRIFTRRTQRQASEASARLAKHGADVAAAQQNEQPPIDFLA
jgi:hypothetical protein